MVVFVTRPNLGAHYDKYFPSLFSTSHHSVDASPDGSIEKKVAKADEDEHGVNTTAVMGTNTVSWIKNPKEAIGLDYVSNDDFTLRVKPFIEDFFQPKSIEKSIVRLNFNPVSIIHDYLVIPKYIKIQLTRWEKFSNVMCCSCVNKTFIAQKMEDAIKDQNIQDLTAAIKMGAIVDWNSLSVENQRKMLNKKFDRNFRAFLGAQIGTVVRFKRDVTYEVFTLDGSSPRVSSRDKLVRHESGWIDQKLVSQGQPQVKN